MNVSKLMTLDIASCGPQDTLNRAAQLMWERDCGCVPVVDGDGRVIGILTDRDICMAAYTKGAALSAIQVGDVMSRAVQTCSPQDDILAAQQRMQEHQIRRMPVVDGQHLLGMISLNDLAIAAERARGKNGAPTADGVARTLAIIGHHRHALEAAAAAQ